MAAQTSQLLSDAVEEFLKFSATQDRASTVTNKRRHLGHLMTFTGNIQTRNVTPNHLDGYFAKRQSAAIQPPTLNNELTTFKLFFKWAAARRYIGALNDPTAGRRMWKVPERARLRVPAYEFPRLLNESSGARDRVVVALGLYLFLRQSEIKTLTLADLDMDAGWLQVTVHKTGVTDVMPISEELHEELATWLAYYKADSGDLQPQWRLCPAKRGMKWIGVGQRKLAPVVSDGQMLRPMDQMVNIEDIAKRSLERIGYPLRDAATGRSLHEGIHTLRRSGARALFDQLAENGYDGALRLVQAMLHHKESAMTERYLGLDLDRKRRNDVLRGKKMFNTTPVAASDDGKVVPLRKKES